MTGHVVLCPNPFRDLDLAVTRRAFGLLKGAGFGVLISPIADDYEELIFPTDITVTPIEQAVRGAGLLVAFGGDGTILRTARAVVRTPTPIIGVNLGRKGFMAELEPDELKLLASCAQGKFSIERRMMADVFLIRNGETIYTDCALNDAAVVGVANTLSLSAYGDGRKIMEYAGDGIVLSTPTGSTAYSMSAGGPLVEPTAENIILTPICAHELNARSFVLAPERIVAIRPEVRKGKRALLSVDGSRPQKLKDADEIVFKKSAYTTLLAHVVGKSFYDMAFEKLGRVK